MKIGIAGTDSTHAEAFSRIINSTEEGVLFDVQVSHLWGQNIRKTHEIALQSSIENVVHLPDLLIGKVDAVMILLRYGKDHLKTALPFIRAGVPVWIDKPFASTTEDADILVKEAVRNNTLLCGGSTCRYIHAVEQIRKAVEGKEYGELRHAYMNFQADANSPYGGLEFYGTHLIEMCFGCFGYLYRSVKSSMSGETVSAIIEYDDFTVCLNFIKDNYRNMAGLFFDKGSLQIDLDITDCYVLGLEAFISILKGIRKPEDPHLFLETVSIMNKISSIIPEKNILNS